MSEVCSISRVSNSIQSMVRGKYVHNDEDDCEQIFIMDVNFVTMYLGVTLIKNL